MPSSVVTNPRFAPRRYTLEPKAFGKAKNIEWVEPVPGTEDQHEASKMQHAWAVAIYNAAVRQYGSIKRYAEANDLRYERLTRIMRGAEIMRLEDIATAKRLLGVSEPSDV